MKQNIRTRRYCEILVFPHLEALYRIALYVSDGESEAQDLVQESFTRAYQSWRKYRCSPNGRLWFFKIMADVLVDRSQRFPRLSTEMNGTGKIDGSLAHPRLVDQKPTDDSEQASFSAISKDDIKKAIGNLPDDFRLIVVLSLLEGFSYQEIADIASLHPKTVRSRLHQGRKLMQQELCDQVACKGNCNMTADRVRRTSTG